MPLGASRSSFLRCQGFHFPRVLLGMCIFPEHYRIGFAILSHMRTSVCKSLSQSRELALSLYSEQKGLVLRELRLK